MFIIFLIINFILPSTLFVDSSIIHGPHNYVGTDIMLPSSGGINNLPIFQASAGFLSLLRRKPYSWMRVSKDSTLKVMWYIHTVVIVEEDDDGKILNCEIVDTIDNSYRKTLLKQLSKDSDPKETDIQGILEIMYECQKVRSPLTVNLKSRIFREHVKKIEALSIFRVILPGTRWCGISDIAFNYHDLGPRKVDRCCRTHDFCPESLLTSQSSWNITNPGPFTRSHCLCEEYLKRCLMDVGNEDSKALGNVYFNLLRIPCIENAGDGRRFRETVSFPTQDNSIDIEGSSEE